MSSTQGKVVLFLGAGFSAPFDLPTMNAFLGFVDRCRRLDDSQRQFVGELVLEARRANSFLESSPTNLEDILSFADMGDRLGLAPPGRAAQLRRILERVYTTAPGPDEYWTRYDKLGAMLGQDPKELRGRISFITTNYDLNLESACAFYGLTVDPGFPIRARQPPPNDRQVHGNLYAPGGIPLYKLHGSVNWFSRADNGELEIEGRIVAAHGSGGAPFPSRLPLPCTSNYNPGAEPFIVPPTYLKAEIPPDLKKVWEGAAKALSEASIVAFVGYSFPPSDTEMRYFLARALSVNPAIRVIHIVDPQADSIIARLLSPASGMGSHFKDLLKGHPSSWAQARFPI